LLDAANTPLLAGQVNVGPWLSFTVTVKEQALELPDASMTAQDTVVVPCANVLPEAGVQTGVPTPGQLSAATGAA